MTPLLLILSLFIATQSPQDQANTVVTPITLPPALARVLTDYENAWKAKDADALANLFTEDGFVLTGGQPPARGRDAIRSLYKGAGGPLSLHAFAYATSGDVGYIIGGFSSEPGVADRGKFTLTLRKVSGRWLIMSDMDNPNTRR
jgi:ketosteroid isomerase-like protein